MRFDGRNHAHEVPFAKLLWTDDMKLSATNFFLLTLLAVCRSQRLRSAKILGHNETTEFIDNETLGLLHQLDGLLSPPDTDRTANGTFQSQPVDPTVTDSSRSSAIWDTVIIGAGWAGLGAAQVLKRRGQGVILLEARDYIGGRSRSMDLDGSLVELGSQWIQGASEANPIHRIAEAKHASMKRSGVYRDVVMTSEYHQRRRGTRTPRCLSQQEYQQILHRTLKEGWMPFQRKRQRKNKRDKSLRATTDAYRQRKGLRRNDTLALEFILDSVVSQEYAASLEDMSTWWWNNDKYVGGGDVILPDGYSSLVDAFAENLRAHIRLSSPVKKIDWSLHHKVRVTYEDGAAGKVLRTVTARNVIVTVPLGVLQAQTIEFRPALPSRKVASINRLGMGLLNKIIIKWDKTSELPWSRNVEWLERIATPQGRWTEFVSYQPTTGEKVLVGFSAGREAARVERMSDSSILVEALQSLEKAYGMSVPQPKAYHITRWSQDAHAHGSYSYYKVGSSPKDRRNLKESLGNRIFFAGEACHLTFPSTTHGALLTGLEAGNEIVSLSEVL